MDGAFDGVCIYSVHTVVCCDLTSKKTVDCASVMIMGQNVNNFDDRVTI